MLVISSIICYRRKMTIGNFLEEFVWREHSAEVQTKKETWYGILGIHRYIVTLIALKQVNLA